MRTRTLVAATMAMLFGAVSATAGVLITPIKILGGPEYQYHASSNGTYLAWTQNSEQRPRKYHAYASSDGGVTPIRLDAPGTVGFFGEVDADSNEAIYQQIDGSASDIYLIDVSDPSTRSIVPNVSTYRWEWQPRVSDTYILFTRAYPRLGVLRLLLYDRAIETFTVLREYPYSLDLFTGDVGATQASWTVCGRNCTAWIYDIAGTDARRIPTVNRKPQYAPVVDEMHSTVYWVRSKPVCGGAVDFRMAPLGDLTNEVKIAELPDGIDTDWTMSLEYDTVNARVDLIFSRYNCRTSDSNIYELQGVDTIP